MKRAIIAVLFVTGIVSAGEVDARRWNQERRINQGVRSGSLNYRETARLRSEEAGLRREIRHDRIDGGRFTYAEKAKINRQENRLSNQIYRAKHN